MLSDFPEVAYFAIATDRPLVEVGRHEGGEVFTLPIGGGPEGEFGVIVVETSPQYLANQFRSVVARPLAGRFGHRGQYLAAGAATIVANVGFYFSDNLVGVIGFSALNGVGFALASLACQDYVIDRLPKERDAYTGAAVANGLPVLVPYEHMVTESQALMSVAARDYDVGRLAGEQAAKILVEGKGPGELPILPMEQFAYMVNMTVASKLSLYPPVEFLQFVEQVQ